MLCKPSIVALPLVTFAIDLIIFKTELKKALLLTAGWLLCTVPFLAITHSIQSVDALGSSAVWQRPFVAGDALSFYLGKILLPINLAIDYGRTPKQLFTHIWCYFTWIVPAILIYIAYRFRKTHPLCFLGSIIFVLFLSPVLGLVPFSYQEYSTVSDRYVYLSLIGIALILIEWFESSRIKFLIPGLAILCAVYAGLSYYQSQFWIDERSFLTHSLDVNPNAGFAYNNLGELDFGNKKYTLALSEFLKGIEIAPGHAGTDINAADCYLALNNPVEAKNMLRLAIKEPGMTGDNWSDMGNVLMKMNDTANGLEALKRGVILNPTKPSCLFNYAKGLATANQLSDAQTYFQQSINIAPSLPGPRIGLGVVLAQTGHLADARDQFAEALTLDPSNPEAKQNFEQAQQMLSQANKSHN